MDSLQKISTSQLAIGLGIITTVMWVTVQGTAALVVSIISAGLIALRSTMGPEETKSD